MAATSLMKLAATPEIFGLVEQSGQGPELLGGRKRRVAQQAAQIRAGLDHGLKRTQRGGDLVGLARVAGQGEQRRRVASRQPGNDFDLFSQRIALSRARRRDRRRALNATSTPSSIRHWSVKRRGAGSRPPTPGRGLPDIGLFAAQPPEAPTKVGGRGPRAVRRSWCSSRLSRRRRDRRRRRREDWQDWRG